LVPQSYTQCDNAISLPPNRFLAESSTLPRRDTKDIPFKFSPPPSDLKDRFCPSAIVFPLVQLQAFLPSFKGAILFSERSSSPNFYTALGYGAHPLLAAIFLHIHSVREMRTLLLSFARYPLRGPFQTSCFRVRFIVELSFSLSLLRDKENLSPLL